MSGDTEKIHPEDVEVLYQEYAADLTAFLLGMLRDQDLVNDVVQTTFMKALESGHTAKSSTIKGWLFRVAHNEAVSLKRRHVVRHKTMEKIADGRIAWRDAKVAEENGLEGFQRLVQREDVVRIRGVVKTLSQAEQEIIRLRIYEQKTFAEISAELSIPLGTALTRMRRAIGKLSGKLREYESDSR